MVKLHLKRLNTPSSWPIKRKGLTFIMRPKSSGHSYKNSLPLGVIFRDILKVAETVKEVQLILSSEKVLVNGREVKDYKFSCGLFDVIEIEKTKQKFIVLLNRFGKFNIVDYKADYLTQRVDSKKIIKGGKFALGLFDGGNMLVSEAEFSKIKVGDSLIVDIKTKKIKEVKEYKEEAFVFIFEGKYVGQVAQVSGFKTYNGRARDLVHLKVGELEFETSKQNCVVLGNKKDSEFVNG